jgi:hypothetical protein
MLTEDDKHDNILYSKRQYYNRHKDDIIANTRRWQLENAEKLKQYSKENLQHSNELARKRYQGGSTIKPCDICGKSYKNIFVHNKTQKHINNLNK